MQIEPIDMEREKLNRSSLDTAVSDAIRFLEETAQKRPNSAQELSRLVARLRALGGAEEAATVRIGFVGAVKSGKSTLVNALLGEDLLPRGAGILTAQLTEVRRGETRSVAPVWKSKEAANRDFGARMADTGATGEWNLADPTHRERGAELAISLGISHPGAEPVRAFVEGYGGYLAELEGKGKNESLHELAADDARAAYLDGLLVYTSSPRLSKDVAMLDCQGSDAWNMAHWADVEETLLSAHRIVFVISGRVGVREADVKLLETLKGYSLMELVTVALNIDLAEMHDRGELDRVVERTRRTLGESGYAGKLYVVSALMSLLEELRLYSPEGLRRVESRTLDVWETERAGFIDMCRENFAALRAATLEESAAESARLVVSRMRTDLRAILLEASIALGAGEEAKTLKSAAWQAEVVETLLPWARERFVEEAENLKGRISREIAKGFAAKGPQVRNWRAQLARLRFGADRAGVDQPLREEAASLLRVSEPVRVNAIRNLALVARGELARLGETVGKEMADRMRESGGEIGIAPPGRRALSAQITVTGRIPLFWKRVRELGGVGEKRLGLYSRLRFFLAARSGSAFADGLSRTTTTAERTGFLGLVGRQWNVYVEEVEGECLHRHVDEAAGQVLAGVAGWALVELGSASTLGSLLGDSTGV